NKVYVWFPLEPIDAFMILAVRTCKVESDLGVTGSYMVQHFPIDVVQVEVSGVAHPDRMVAGQLEVSGILPLCVPMLNKVASRIRLFQAAHYFACNAQAERSGGGCPVELEVLCRVNNMRYRQDVRGKRRKVKENGIVERPNDIDPTPTHSRNFTKLFGNKMPLQKARIKSQTLWKAFIVDGLNVGIGGRQYSLLFSWWIKEEHLIAPLTQAYGIVVLRYLDVIPGLGRNQQDILVTQSHHRLSINS